MDIEKAFSELGVSAVLGTGLMAQFGLSADDFAIPSTFVKFKSIVDFLVQFPEDTQRFLITKGTRGSMGDKLEHFFDYANILKEKAAYQQVLEKVNKEVEILEHTNDPQIIGEVKARQADLQEKIHRLTEEQNLWE